MSRDHISHLLVMDAVKRSQNICMLNSAFTNGYVCEIIICEISPFGLEESERCSFKVTVQIKMILIFLHSVAVIIINDLIYPCTSLFWSYSFAVEIFNLTHYAPLPCKQKSSLHDVISENEVGLYRPSNKYHWCIRPTNNHPIN